ncbi:MAG: hypothetical protein Q7K57_14730 [Burkholderiaceae bacterium]|nr:hypothetical protein [Burkholderiaceae bacterium]
MKLLHITVAFLAAVCVLAQAQPVARKGADERVAQLSESRCNKEIRDYVDAVRFVRQAAGEQIGDRVVKSYVSEGELSRWVTAQGPCAAAQLLRDKGASR